MLPTPTVFMGCASCAECGAHRGIQEEHLTLLLLPFKGQACDCSSSSHRRPAHLPPSPLDCRLAWVSHLRITVPSTACTPLSDHIASLMKTFHQQSGDQAALHNGQTFPELALTCLFSSCFCMPRCAHIYVSY